MKLLACFICGLTLAAPAYSTEMMELLKLKKSNYQKVIQYDESLESSAKDENYDRFCRAVEMIKPTLEKVLNDDHLLMDALIKTGESDAYDYAKHIEDNSLSNLFANQSHLERCEKRNFEPRKVFLQSLRYNLMNEHYLLQTHVLWMNATGR